MFRITIETNQSSFVRPLITKTNYLSVLLSNLSLNIFLNSTVITEITLRIDLLFRVIFRINLSNSLQVYLFLHFLVSWSGFSNLHSSLSIIICSIYYLLISSTVSCIRLNPFYAFSSFRPLIVFFRVFFVFICFYFFLFCLLLFFKSLAFRVWFDFFYSEVWAD